MTKEEIEIKSLFERRIEKVDKAILNSESPTQSLYLKNIRKMLLQQFNEVIAVELVYRKLKPDYSFEEFFNDWEKCPDRLKEVFLTR